MPVEEMKDKETILEFKSKTKQTRIINKFNRISGLDYKAALAVYEKAMGRFFTKIHALPGDVHSPENQALLKAVYVREHIIEKMGHCVGTDYKMRERDALFLVKSNWDAKRTAKLDYKCSDLRYEWHKAFHGRFGWKSTEYKRFEFDEGDSGKVVLGKAFIPDEFAPA